MGSRRQKPEKEIENQILGWLNLQHDIFVWKANTTGMYDPTKNVYRSLRGFAIKGISDILGIHAPSGRMIAIEVKTPARRKQVSAEQEYFLDRVTAFGGMAGVATCLEDAALIMGVKI